MQAQENTQTVQAAYALFSKGDIPNLLALFSDDIEFIVPGAPALIPYAGVYRGKEAVATFFARLHEAVDFERFEPMEYLAQGESVVALGYGKARVRATGQSTEEEWAHVFRLREGKVGRFQEYTDTAALVQAFQGSHQLAQ